MSPTMLDIKNANKLQKNYFKYRKNDRMNDFNISVAAKHRGDDNQEKKNILPCKMRQIFKYALYCLKFRHVKFCQTAYKNFLP